MKTLKEMFTRKAKMGNCRIEFQCPKEAERSVADSFRLSGGAVRFYPGDQDCVRICVDMNLMVNETDEEVIERARKEHEENMKTLEELLAAYYEVPNFYSVISARARFDSAVDKFKRGESI